MRFYKYFCRQKAAVVLRKVAESLQLDCGQNAVPLRSLAYICGFLRFSAVAQVGKWGSGITAAHTAPVEIDTGLSFLETITELYRVQTLL